MGPRFYLNESENWVANLEATPVTKKELQFQIESRARNGIQFIVYNLLVCAVPQQISNGILISVRTDLRLPVSRRQVSRRIGIYLRGLNK